jgi:hypothetical protein
MNILYQNGSTQGPLEGAAKRAPTLGNRDRDGSLISLYALMYEVRIGEFVAILDRLNYYSSTEAGPNGYVLRPTAMSLEGVLGDIYKYADILNFDATLRNQIYELQDVIDNDYGFTSPQEFDVRVRSLQFSLSQLLKDRKFLYMPPEEAKFYLDPGLFGWEVMTAFPEANVDMLEAGTAYAASLDTACVFHCMRVAEFGLRHIAEALEIELTDKKKPIPIEFATWEKVLQEIDNKRAALRLEPKGHEPNDKARFYADCGETLSHLKDLYRNDVMHTRRHYNEHNAMDAMQRVSSLMKKLAERQKEEKLTKVE